MPIFQGILICETRQTTKDEASEYVEIITPIIC